MNRLMTHVVVGYPDLATTKKLLREMISRRVAAIELQIPFSDPIADGPVLMRANDVAVANQIGAKDSLDLLSSLSGQGTELYIMTYLQPIQHYGAQEFFRKALEHGCKGFIIPDLPFDASETKQLLQEVKELQSALVPVLSPGMDRRRLDELFQVLLPRLVYVTARHGITGDKSTFDAGLDQVIKMVRSRTKARIAVGFGIQKPADVRVVLGRADLAVVGSALTGALNVSEARALTLLDSLCSAADNSV